MLLIRIIFSSEQRNIIVFASNQPPKRLFWTLKIAFLGKNALKNTIVSEATFDMKRCFFKPKTHVLSRKLCFFHHCLAKNVLLPLKNVFRPPKIVLLRLKSDLFPLLEIRSATRPRHYRYCRLFVAPVTEDTDTVKPRIPTFDMRGFLQLNLRNFK